MISELDVDVLPRRVRGADVAARERGGADPYRSGLPPEVAEAQARFYGRIFQVVLKHPGVVTRVTFWGTHDGTSWLNFWPVAFRTNHPLLWDRALKPKPALGAVLDVLANSVTKPGQTRRSGARLSAGVAVNTLEPSRRCFHDETRPLFLRGVCCRGPDETNREVHS